MLSSCPTPAAHPVFNGDKEPPWPPTSLSTTVAANFPISKQKHSLSSSKVTHLVSDGGLPCTWPGIVTPALGLDTLGWTWHLRRHPGSAVQGLSAHLAPASSCHFLDISEPPLSDCGGTGAALWAWPSCPHSHSGLLPASCLGIQSPAGSPAGPE